MANSNRQTVGTSVLILYWMSKSIQQNKSKINNMFVKISPPSNHIYTFFYVHPSIFKCRFLNFINLPLRHKYVINKHPVPRIRHS